MVRLFPLVRVVAVVRVVAALGVTALGGTSCQSLEQPLSLRLMGRVRSIESVQTRANVGSTLYVRGNVGDRVPLVNGQVYELQDSTGEIWVVTTDPTITTGEDLLIQGTLSYLATPDFGADAGERYLWETKQIERSPE